MTPTPNDGFESDVAARPVGDNIVLATDVIQMRRFATNLDVPEEGTNEFQRADSAPFATRGDGLINAADVIQTRRYAAQLDPLTPAGGPNGPVPLPVTEAGSPGSIPATIIQNPRRLSIVTDMVQGPRRVSVSVYLNAIGDEVATNFTLLYDRHQFVDPVIDDGGKPEVGTLTLNATTPGRLVILADAFEPLARPLERVRIVKISFTIVAPNSGSHPAFWFDRNGNNAVSDFQGNLLSFDLTDE